MNRPNHRARPRAIAASRALLAAVLASLLGTFATSSYSQVAAHQPTRWVGGWLTYWQFEQGLESIRHSPDTFQDVYFFIGQLSPSGDPMLAASKHDYRATIQQLKTQGKRSWLTVVNDVVSPAQKAILKDPYVVSRLLASHQSRQQHITNLVSLASEYGFYGIDIDYESLRHRDRNRFSLFIEELAQALQPHNIRLAVTVQPKVRDQRRNGAGVNDWQRLCRVADRLQIMLYNEHSGKTGPGPIASTAWIEKVLDHAEQKCPAEKIVPSLKVLGASWEQHKVRGITYQQAVALARQHNATVERTRDQVPHFTIAGPNATRTTYFEDGRSMANKLTMLQARGYNQVMLWRLGSYDLEINRELQAFRKAGLRGE